MFKKRKSFTLVELLMVIAIIGILSAVVIVNVSQARLAARDSQRIADLASIQLALEKYKSANGHYPITCTVYPAINSCVNAAGLPGDINTAQGNWRLWAQSANGGCEWNGTCRSGIDDFWGTPLGTMLNKYLPSIPVPPLNNTHTTIVRGDYGKCNDRVLTSVISGLRPMTYLYRSDDGINYKLMTYLESRCNGINANDGGFYDKFYEVFNSPTGRDLTE